MYCILLGRVRAPSKHDPQRNVFLSFNHHTPSLYHHPQSATQTSTPQQRVISLLPHGQENQELVEIISSVIITLTTHPGSRGLAARRNLERPRPRPGTQFRPFAERLGFPRGEAVGKRPAQGGGQRAVSAWGPQGCNACLLIACVNARGGGQAARRITKIQTPSHPCETCTRFEGAHEDGIKSPPPARRRPGDHGRRSPKKRSPAHST